jgi:hypothetical protein
MLIALFSWAGLLLFTYRVPPLTFPAFIAVFLILAVALTSTGAPIAYMINRLFSPTQSTVRSAIRRGALFALIVVLNLMLRAVGSWNVLTAILIVLAVIVVEVVALAHK